ncbi:hypothetical protein NUU61_007974 [Penicillium alfredii]|uniref:GST N-terminal domain-containing protein n=1 Tax=Penicillium alfredii TaxID=1506179 RepID=A0A9W9ERI5_9EURO|nr:uncharacterized protein NUU61_007974 [Penicillium alfredii]KAJ5086667.1 hypothetical protein NUU61_007974 [Penicillium alfredii]
MDSDLQRLPSPRPLASGLPIVDDTPSLTAELGPFDPDSQSFTPFRNAIDKVESQPLQNATHADNSAFLRPPRPGEPVDTLLTASQPHQQSQLHRDHGSHVASHLQHPSANHGFDQSRTTGNGVGKSQIGISASAHIEQSLDDSVAAKMPSATSLSQNGLALSDAHDAQRNGMAMLQSPGQSFQHPDLVGLEPGSVGSTNFAGQLQGMKLIPDPPDLEYWRERLFHVDETITLSEEQFQVYFPHVDNVYSHRSTQRYKRKPFVSHYWDCRLKGRPPGTPKSDDPNKKKRKRTARERDLCDVKIKITEHFSGSVVTDMSSGIDALPSDLLPGVNTLFNHGDAVQDNQPFVNGNGANGKNDGIGGGHRHTLEESDRVKKNSVQRHFLKWAKEKKKASVCLLRAPSWTVSGGGAWRSPQNPRLRHTPFTSEAQSNIGNHSQVMSDASQTQKTYHTKATGLAATTAINHAAEDSLKLYGSCFCPFVQRVWIALELKGIPYQYIEVDPYQKPTSLLEVNPRGLVPALRHGDWGCYESNVLLEYLEDLGTGTALFPADARLRAHCRLWADHINRNIVPNFYRVLQEQDEQKQIANAQELRNAFNLLIAVAHPHGPFFLGPQPSFVDIQAAPWVLRLSRVLKPYRGWPDVEEGSRWAVWVNAIESNEHVQATTSTDELYLDSYERYAQNRPNTSRVANAINAGRGLP